MERKFYRKKNQERRGEKKTLRMIKKSEGKQSMK